jgi:hypothetical protein
MNMHTLGWAIDTLMKPPENVIDIDIDETDIFMHPEYHSDIIKYLRVGNTSNVRIRVTFHQRLLNVRIK